MFCMVTAYSTPLLGGDLFHWPWYYILLHGTAMLHKANMNKDVLGISSEDSE